MNFWNGFLKGPFENSVMFLKIKEINFKKKHMNQNTKQNKREQDHKVEFLTTEKIEGENGGQSSWVSKDLKKRNQIKWRITKATSKAF